MRTETGFTLFELLVVFVIMSIVSTIAFPSFSRLNGQMRAAQDIRTLAAQFSELRAEAIRMRTNVRVTFSSAGYSWDIDDNGSTEGTHTLSSQSSWSPSTPSAILFNGLGLARGIVSQATISVSNRGHSNSLYINSNGHIKL